MDEECLATISGRTRRFARRQRTWYRKFEGVAWLRTSSDLERALEVAGWPARAIG